MGQQIMYADFADRQYEKGRVWNILYIGSMDGKNLKTE
jgi:hypothetical protein